MGIPEGLGLMGFTGNFLGFSRVTTEFFGFGVSPGCSPREEKPRKVPEVWNLSQDLSVEFIPGFIVGLMLE